jgi:hypothetical protein
MSPRRKVWNCWKIMFHGKIKAHYKMLSIICKDKHMYQVQTINQHFEKNLQQKYNIKHE